MSASRNAIASSSYRPTDRLVALRENFTAKRSGILHDGPVRDVCVSPHERPVPGRQHNFYQATGRPDLTVIEQQQHSVAPPWNASTVELVDFRLELTVKP